MPTPASSTQNEATPIPASGSVPPAVAAERTDVVEPPPSAHAIGREAAAVESRNLLALAAHHITLRVGWIFKTESVIMPAFLDAVVGVPALRGLVRGCLPVLNRIGQSIPPLFYADKMRRLPHKKWALFITTVLMAVPFLILAATWQINGGPSWWLPLLFLALYTIFFSMTGLNQLAFGTIQGKLIRPDRRGRLMSLSGIIGAVAAISCAWFLLRHWLQRDDGGFGLIFGFTGMGFLVSAGFCLAIVEPEDGQEHRQRREGGTLANTWKLIRTDGDFRRAVCSASLFMTAMWLFPHYQALGRVRLESQHADLMGWVIAQNAGAGLYSLVAGHLADRFGNRLAIRLQVLTVAFTPLLALAIAGNWFGPGRSVYWLTFLLLGLTPVTMRTFVNYTLELAEPQDHPQYISTLKLFMGLPVFLSPLVGLLVDERLLGFDTVFIGVAVAIFLGGLLTFRMSEPRQRLAQADSHG